MNILPCAFASLRFYSILRPFRELNRRNTKTQRKNHIDSLSASPRLRGSIQFSAPSRSHLPA
jgi:uncharacterized protein with NAD-binding domain and iron-sulfur cluster